MRKIILPALCMTALWLFNSCQDTKREKEYANETQLDETGLTFVRGAAEADHTEIAASKMAEKNSKNLRVEGFAQMIIADHTKADMQLTKVAANNQADLPPGITPQHRKMIDSISKLSGEQFDKAYMGMMVHDHETAVNFYSDSKEDRAEVIKNYIKKTLPVIDAHLDSAKAIYASLK